MAKLGEQIKKSIFQVPLGSVLLFTNMTVHRSYENVTDRIRWSMDWRWTVGYPLNKLWTLTRGNSSIDRRRRQ